MRVLSDQILPLSPSLRHGHSAVRTARDQGLRRVPADGALLRAGQQEAGGPWAYPLVWELEGGGGVDRLASVRGFLSWWPGRPLGQVSTHVFKTNHVFIHPLGTRYQDVLCLMSVYVGRHCCLATTAKHWGGDDNGESDHGMKVIGEDNGEPHHGMT